MILRKIQAQLSAIYDLTVEAEVDDFLCDRATVEAALGEPNRGEVLLVAEPWGEDPRLGLYVDPNALETLAAQGDPWIDGRAFEASLATEGVSHFLYLMHHEQDDRGVSQLELELQAEVDKYVQAVAAYRVGSPATWNAATPLPSYGLTESMAQQLRGYGAGLVASRSRALRAQLFRRVRFRDEETSEEGQRYRLAHEAAEKFVKQLEYNYLYTCNYGEFVSSIRRFYRAPLEGKIRACG